MLTELWQQMLDATQGLSFARPYWWLLLPLLLALLGWQRYSERYQQRWQQHLSPTLLNILLRQPAATAGAGLSPRGLALLMLLCWLLVLSGPRWQGGGDQTKSGPPLVISLALDEQMQPARLRWARLQLYTLLDQYAGSPMALQVFAGSAHRVLPFTRDLDSLRRFIEPLQPALMPLPGWQPLQALQAGEQLLQRQPQPGLQLLITAGAVPLAEALAGWKASPATAPVLLWHLSDQPGALPGLAPGLHYYPMSGVDTALPGLQRLLLNRQGAGQHGQGHQVAGLDLGYYLCWPLLVLTLLWFRRGRLLQWQ